MPPGSSDGRAFAPRDFLGSVAAPLLTAGLRLEALRVEEPLTGGGGVGRFFRARAVISLPACSPTPRQCPGRKGSAPGCHGVQGGGRCRHWQPVRPTYNLPSPLCFLACLGPLPRRARGSKWWALCSPGAAVQSLGELLTVAPAHHLGLDTTRNSFPRQLLMGRSGSHRGSPFPP